MSKGVLKRVKNLNPSINSASEYYFCKVEEKYAEEEEYWLITQNQLEHFLDRAIENSEDIPQTLEVGEFQHVENKKAHRMAREFYIAAVLELEEEGIDILMTSHELSVIRERVEDNREDIEANKEHWLFALFA